MLKYKSPLSRLLEGSAKSESKMPPAAGQDPSDSAIGAGLDDAVAGLDALRQSFAAASDIAAEPKAEMAETPKVSAPEPKAAAPEPVEPEPAIDLGSVSRPISKPAEPAASPAPAQSSAASRRERAKTTFLGFENTDAEIQALMSSNQVEKPSASARLFPVGWLVVTGGPGRGFCAPLVEGLMQIGRNDNQAVQLDFGDLGISRESHAVIAYDHEARRCFLGHGGKSNLVRLNGHPVLTTTALNDGDEIRISETVIRYVAFCDDDFDWRVS